MTARRIARRLLPAPAAARASWIRRFGVTALPARRSLAIPGFLADVEAVELYRIARALPPGAVVVELGSWLGKTSVIFATALRRRPGSRLVCVDPFSGAGDERSSRRYRSIADGLEQTLRQEFEANLAGHGVMDVVTVLEGYSHEFSPDWQTPIDCLFIDADHSYEAVLRDFREWSPHVKPGGWLLFHDCWIDPPRGAAVYHTGPARVVREHVLHDADWDAVGQVWSLFRARRVRPPSAGTLGSS